MGRPRSSAAAETKMKASRPVGRPRKNTQKVKAESESKPVEEVEVEDTGKDEEKCKIDWDSTLSTKLLNAIMDNPNIKQGLYPSPGGSMASLNSGGNKKTVWQWKLAIELFKGHAEYGEAFAYTLNCPNGRTASQRQNVWGAKIKNRLVRMAAITRQHIETLGQTGEGINHAEDVDMSLNNEFTNKWAKIIAECPWFLEMRALIAERPNLVPTGIGNSSSDFDIEVLHDDPSLDDDTEAPTSEGYDILHDEVADAIMGTSDIEEEDKKPVVKRKAALALSDSEDIKPTIKTTHAQPGKSKPATTTGSKKRTRLEELSVAAQAEELTRQKELEVNKAKIEASARVKIENSQVQRDIINAKLELKRQSKEERAEKRKMRKEIELQKMRFDHELNLAKLRMTSGMSSAPTAPPLAPSNWADDPTRAFELNYNFTQEDFQTM